MANWSNAIENARRRRRRGGRRWRRPPHIPALWLKLVLIRLLPVILFCSALSACLCEWVDKATYQFLYIVAIVGASFDQRKRWLLLCAQQPAIALEKREVEMWQKQWRESCNWMKQLDFREVAKPNQMQLFCFSLFHSLFVPPQNRCEQRGREITDANVNGDNGTTANLITSNATISLFFSLNVRSSRYFCQCHNWAPVCTHWLHTRAHAHTTATRPTSIEEKKRQATDWSNRLRYCRSDLVFIEYNVLMH